MPTWEILSPIHSEPVHLGDQESQKVKLEGARWSTAFLHHHEASDTLYFEASILSTASPENRVLINSRPVGHLPATAGQGFEKIRLEIPDGVVNQGGNELTVEAGAMPRKSDLDDFLIRDMSIARVLENDGSGDGDSGDGDSNGRKAEFFQRLGQEMAKLGWETRKVPGFGWAAIETQHFDLDFVYAAFDGDATTTPENAHKKLSGFADELHWPNSRIAVAVFDSPSDELIETIVKGANYRAGERGETQSMTGVISLATGRFHEPAVPFWNRGGHIRFNEATGRQLLTVVRRITGN